MEKRERQQLTRKEGTFTRHSGGQNVKNSYEERAKTRDQLIEILMTHKPGTNLAEMEKETILKLVRRMK